MKFSTTLCNFFSANIATLGSNTNNNKQHQPSKNRHKTHMRTAEGQAKCGLKEIKR